MSSCPFLRYFWQAQCAKRVSLQWDLLLRTWDGLSRTQPPSGCILHMRGQRNVNRCKTRFTPPMSQGYSQRTTLCGWFTSFPIHSSDTVRRPSSDGGGNSPDMVTDLSHRVCWRYARVRALNFHPLVPSEVCSPAFCGQVPAPQAKRIQAIRTEQRFK